MHFLRLEDFASPTWKRLTQELEHELERLRELNDQDQHDAVKTASIRGQIKQLKKLIARADEARAQSDGPEEAPLIAGWPAPGDAN